MDTSSQVMRRVLLVEDEALTRTLLAEVLVAADFAVESCSTAREAVEIFDAWDPDAVISDIDLGTGPSGLDLVVSLKKRAPWLAAVILSNYTITPEYRATALANVPCVRKNDLSNVSILVDALSAALDDTGPPVGSHPTSLLSTLTHSQTQVLRMLAEGLSNEEIAKRRHTNVKSVEGMIHRIFSALGLTQDPSVNNRVAAVRIFIREAGLPTPQGDRNV